MIFIVGSEVDLSTFQVIDYLLYKKIPFVKVNDTDIIDNFRLELDGSGLGLVLRFRDEVVSTEKLSAYYYRRGNINLPITEVEQHVDDISPTDINPYLSRERRTFHSAINIILESVPRKIGAFTKYDLEKLKQLLEAKVAEISIPATFVIQTKAELTELVERHGPLATKAVTSNFLTNLGGRSGYNMFTSLIGKEELKLIPDVFFPTLFQIYIPKKIELRIFYLHGKFYPMAIFSQENEQTKIDFRRYDTQRPNRNTPFNLPNEVASKLEKLMNKLGLDTGSIDMILTNNNEFVFLEVNPDGQFGMVSQPCNYFIERDIANYLSDDGRSRTEN